MMRSSLLKFSFFGFFIFILSISANAQYRYRASIRSEHSGEALEGVTVSTKDSTKPGTLSDGKGLAILKDLPAGENTIVFSSVGFKTMELTVHLPDSTMHIVLMEEDAKALKDVVVVASTRSNDRIENAATKVEVLGQEEMNEESTLKPGNIASILGDVSGVQIQQSSATTGNSNVRIQGLDGSYTQIMRDGMPLYGGYSGSFGILTIPPLNLKQIELIKGSSSTLYGGGAIAGLVNLISKKPNRDPEASFLINQTTLRETNVNAYYAQRSNKVGFTLFAGQTYQHQMDVNNDEFSDLPNTKSTLIHPVLFFYPSSKSEISLGWEGSFDHRIGGDMKAIEGKEDPAHPYFEENRLKRNVFTLMNSNHINSTFSFFLKASLSVFNRNETTNSYTFNGTQNNYYSEISFVKRASKHTVVGGLNITGNDFSPSAATPAPVGNITNNTLGVFLQDSWQLAASTRLETGLRYDHHFTYGDFLLPRVALFHRFNEHWGSRLGFGMGYTTPDPLIPQFKDYTIYQLQPIAKGVKGATSYGGNLEFNYKMQWSDESSLFINQAFFITSIENPIIGEEDAFGKVFFTNKARPVLTRGFDTYIQAKLPDWEFYLGYTYTDAQNKYLTQNQFMLYTPSNRAAATALYEVEGNFRIGLEASFNGYQHRDDYSKTPSYLFMAAMAEKKFGPRWSLVLNCENLLNVKQSNYESLYTGSIANPEFKTLWAPIDGRVLNLCLRLMPFAK